MTPPLPDRIAAAIEVLVDRAAVGRGVADARCDLRAAIAEVVAERDAATKRADGLAAELAEAKADAERLANENAELWEAFQRVEDRSAGIDPHPLSDDAILSREDIAELVEEANSKRGDASGRSMREIAEFEMVCTRSEYVSMATNLARLSNDRDAATKCSNGLVADLAACVLSRDKALADLAAAQAYRDSMVAAFAKLYGPEVPIDEHAATLGRLIADSHTLADIAVELMDTEHGAEGSLAEAVRVLVSNLAAAQAKLAEVDRKRQILADIAVEAAGWLAGLAGRPSCSCDPGDLVKRLLDTAQSGQPAQRDDDGTASGGGAQ